MFDVGHVMAFRLRPHWGLLRAAALVLILGVIAVLLLLGDYREGRLESKEHACIVAGVVLVVSGILAIAATSRLWFRTLHHSSRI